METECKRVIPFLFLSLLFCNGFAQTKTSVGAGEPLKSYSRWYSGAEYATPFLFGDLTSFSTDKTYVGSQFGEFAGYQTNSWISIEASARIGYTRMGAKSYASDRLLSTDGMTYYTKRDFATWKYGNVFSKVHFTNPDLQMNLSVNNFFGPNQGNRRWTVLLSPAVYVQRFSTELVNKADENPLSGKKTDDWNFGVGGDLPLRYKISRASDVQLRTGIIWVNNNKMDSVSTLIKSKDHFMTSVGLSLIWRVGKKRQDNVLYVSKHVTDIAVRYIEGSVVNLPTPVYCTEDSIEKNRMKQEIASLNMQLQQAQMGAKERVESNPVLGSNGLPPVYFKRGSAYLNVALYKNELSRVVETLKKYPDLKVALLGYADHTGDPDINQKISLQRAGVLAAYLERKGIGSKHINVKGECVDMLTSDPNNYSVLARRVIVEIQK